jgi:hypothetical protein
MTDRQGNTNAQRVEEREVHSAKSSGYAPLEERSTSWVSVVLGWLAALGAGLILSGIVSGIIGAIFGTAGRQGLTEGGATALVGLLITLLLAFLIGGYAAGRMASRSGLKHGLLVPLIALAGGRRELHRPALGRDAAPGSAAERPAGRPAAGPRDYPERLGHPRLALPVFGRGHRRPLGGEDRHPQALAEHRIPRRAQPTERVGR